MSNEPTNNLSISDVLSQMIQQLDTGNSAVVGQIKDIGQTTSTSIDRIAGSAVNIPRATPDSSVSKELLNAFSPLSSTKGSNILTSLFLGPVWKGLFSLFDGGSESQQAPLSKFSFAEATRTDIASSLRLDGQPSSVRTDAFGLTQSNPAPQVPINISIQALDARSILDRSDDIASALKQALLSNHEINNNLNEI